LKDSLENRDKLRQHLSTQGIGTAIYYPLSLHLQEVFKSLGYKQGDFPESERAQEKVLSLPMYPELSKEQIETIAKTIEEFLEG
jgi:dTDP-4-amino-4,6-dideoxygalactose transaminase